ncbi:MAG TPA: GAF domain-containing protein, partial [Casimicrobiaceae bacterium]|nr:GAF domain-containing protein [Casimicrobiaceae bacterium]
MAIVDTATRKRPARRRLEGKPAPAAQLSSPDGAAAARDLAWTGQHAKAIDACTAALLAIEHAGRSKIAERLTLLDLRAESYIALGKLDHAARDAERMIQVASRDRSPAFRAQALNRSAIVQMRQGDLSQAIDAAVAAAKAARQSRRKGLIGESLLSLGEALCRAGRHDVALKTAREAIAIFEAAGDTLRAGRANWVVAFAYRRLGRGRESRLAGERALELANRTGDRYGIGNALVILEQSDPDIAGSVRRLHQATQAFEAAGYAERRGVALGNLAANYGEFGLYRHAYRLQNELVSLHREMRAKQQLAYILQNLTRTEITLGDIDSARLHLRESAETLPAKSDPNSDAGVAQYRGHLALAEGDPGRALDHYKAALQIAHDASLGRENVFLTMLAQAHLLNREPGLALEATTRATAMHRAQSFAIPDAFLGQEIWWRHAQALAANNKGREAEQALERAYKLLLERVTNLRDDGLRRNYLNKVAVNREIISAWLAYGTKRRLSQKRLLAHLHIESDVREPFQRLADTGLRLNALHTAEAIHAFIVDEATELCGGERVLLVLERDGRRELGHALVPAGEDERTVLDSIEPYLSSARRTGVVSLVHTPESAPALKQRSRVVAPLVVQGKVLGYLYADMDGVYGRFDDTDCDMLGLLASQAAVALDNAQWSQGLEQKVQERTAELTASNASLEQRNAELAIINSIQAGLASKLDFHAIIDLVGDKLRDVFGGADLGITWYDENAHLLHYLYFYEHGKRLPVITRPPTPGGLFETRSLKRQPTIFTCLDDYKRAGMTGPIPGTDQSLSMINVPIIGSDRVLGDISLENFEREHAYGEAELRLLSTVAATMGVALENARLFDETQRLFKAEQQRAAELVVINSIQQGMAAKLEFQAIVDLVGDKLREVFQTGDIGIWSWDEAARLAHPLYVFEHGVRHYHGPFPVKPGSASDRIINGEVLVARNRTEQDALGFELVPGTDRSYSVVGVPIVGGNRVVGSILLENYEKENAFGEAEIRLLTTVAASMGGALENARLFDETQRLFKAEQQRAAELAVINSIQQGMAAKLDFQAIVDLVGDKLREVFHTGDIGIRWFDYEKKIVHYLYDFEHGKRLAIPPAPPRLGWDTLISRREPRVINTVAESAEVGVVPGTDISKSSISVPIIGSDRVIGGITIETFEREYAYGESDVRLLSTIASSMGVALENARLFDETQRLFKAEQQRAAELAVINSIQQGMASKLDFQAIVDLVGDKLREVFNTGDIGIRWFDRSTGLMHYLYQFEHGNRQTVAPREPLVGGPWSRISNTRQPLVLRNRAEAEAIGTSALPGTDDSQSSVFVPILGGDKVLGLIVLEDYEREDAFGVAEVRLLSTVAASMGVALENARLFDETQRLLKETEQRAAELAIINSIQQGLAAQLDFQAIVDMVGDKLREVFATPDLGIRWYNEQTGQLHYLYNYEHGKNLEIAPRVPVPGGMFETMVRTREPVIINTAEEYGDQRQSVVPGTDASKSMIAVPIIGSDRVLGLIGIENYERENAFDRSDLRLLTTIAASLGTALEKARLFDETQRLLKETEQRNAELAIINSVQAALAAELNIQGIYDAVGDKIREIFNNRDMGIRIYDPKTELMHFPYVYEKGKRIQIDSRRLAERGFARHVIDTRETLVINEKMDEVSARYGSFTLPGTEDEKAAVFVPLVVGEQARGLISLMDVEREHAFSDSDVRLLQTLANSMSVALENARLFDETQRLLKETEQRNAELAIINSVQAALAAELNIQDIYDAVGDKIREIFGNRDMGIRVYDPRTGLIHYPYAYENGRRLNIDSHPLNETGFAAYVLRTRETLVVNGDMASAYAKYGSTALPGTEMEKATVVVPLIVGDQTRGTISLADMEHEQAFNDSDVRLLQTLANSMSVALENARLFDETQRLLKETEQRAAELTVINKIQEGMSAKLEFLAIIDLVGDKLRDVFKTGDLSIRWHDPKDDVLHYLYEYKRGERINKAPMKPSPDGIWSKLLKSRRPIVAHTRADARAQGMTTIPGTQESHSSVFLPILTGERALGMIAMEDYDREHAYGEAE